MAYNLPPGCTQSDVDEANQCYQPCEACGEREWDCAVRGSRSNTMPYGDYARLVKTLVDKNQAGQRFYLCAACAREYRRNEYLRERLAKQRVNQRL